MNRRTDVATDRIRNVASACVIANDGPKKTAAINMRPTNDGSVTARLGERYARNWKVTQTSVAMPGTHMYQRRSLVRLLRRSDRYPPRKVPTPAMAART